MTSRGTVTRLAPAKINLCLRVLGRRAAGLPHAGYHEVDSLVVFAGVGDRLSFRLARDIDLALEGPFAAALEGEADNLVLRAARLLQGASGTTVGASIVLDKRLPVASGIGGGSADAAATLLGLAELWGLRELDLSPLAEQLGADVPVCLTGKPCRVTGIGEELTPLPPLPAVTLLLVNPLVPSPTAPVFAARQGAFSQPLSFSPASFADARALAGLVREGGNDLSEPAQRLVPTVGEVLEALRRLQPLAAAMSGSGATCFALFAEAGEAAEAAHRLRRERPQWWSATAPLLD